MGLFRRRLLPRMPDVMLKKEVGRTFSIWSQAFFRLSPPPRFILSPFHKSKGAKRSLFHTSFKNFLYFFAQLDGVRFPLSLRTVPPFFPLCSTPDDDTIRSAFRGFGAGVSLDCPLFFPSSFWSNGGAVVLCSVTLC